MEVEQTDEALMLLYGNGEVSAFECLYHRHKGSMYRYIQRNVGTLLDCDEVFQDVWAKVINAAPRYQVAAKFTTWLYTVAHNCIVDGVRKHQRSPVALVPNGKSDGYSDGNEENELAESDRLVSDYATDDPMKNVSVQQQIDQLLIILTGLPIDQREVFLLKHEAGFSIAEIAEIIGVGEETAKTRLRYAMKKIRAAMSGTQDVGEQYE